MESKKGKKNRKHGRCVKSPSHQRYNFYQRWIENKVRRIVKQMRKFPNYKPYNLSPTVKKEVMERLKDV